MYKKEFIEYIENDGWIICCESPLELEHKDGDTATGLAAEYVLDELDVEYCNYINSLNVKEEQIDILEGKRYSDFEPYNIEYTKYKIIVPTNEDKIELIKAFEHIHYSMIDTDIIAVNQLAHEYLEGYSIIVDEEKFNEINK